MGRLVLVDDNVETDLGGGCGLGLGIDCFCCKRNFGYCGGNSRTHIVFPTHGKEYRSQAGNNMYTTDMHTSAHDRFPSTDGSVMKSSCSTSGAPGSKQDL